MAQRSVFPNLLGNKTFSSVVGGDILTGRLGHAYILEGPAGSGRHTAVRQIAAALSCTARNVENKPLPCGECLICRKIESGISPDVLYFRRPEDRATIGVDTIRQMKESLWLAPNENEKKIYVVEDADTMTAQAQNALLLSLEEPPPYVIFFLLTENAGALLETIRSRAPVLRMELFDAPMLSDILRKNKKFERISRADPSCFAEAVVGSGGALGQAQTLLDRASDDCAVYLTQRRDALRIVSALFTSGGTTATEILSSIPKAREDVSALFEFVLLALRDLVAVKKNAGVPLRLYLSPDECRTISDKTSVSRILAAYDDVMQAWKDILSNASIQPVCTALLMKKH